MSWTEERVETLKRMWNEGQSASQIAKELGGVTRNAVIGKVHRLGLSNRTGGVAAAAPAAATGESAEGEVPADKGPGAEDSVAAMASGPAPAAPADDEPGEKPATTTARVTTSPRKQIIPAGQPLPPQPSANEISPEALASVRETEKKARKLSLMELTERTCKWPVGDPATEDFWFCGLTVKPGKPYCEAHVGVAFQPMSSRRDRKR